MSDLSQRPVAFVLVGGFLGAGKTTTCGRIGMRLAETGRRVGVITNDQAEDLVDTALARLAGLPVAEIAGGCFCCRFQDLVRRCDEILEAIQPDVLLAEPVGSCADLSATVLQPIKRFYGGRLRVKPYTVLVDPERLGTHLVGPLAASPVGYLFHKQLEEADLLVVNKIDTVPPASREVALRGLRSSFPATAVLTMSALTGEGFDPWWTTVETGGPGGQQILEIDYDTYAAAEAALGWLNATVSLTAEAPFDPAELAVTWLAALRHGAVRAVADIGHLKLLVEAGGAAARYSVTSAGGAMGREGELPPAVEHARVTLNARVTMPPEDLSALASRSLRKLCNERGIRPQIERQRSFRPGRPNPTMRLDQVEEEV